ncbi:MAG: hypothetical protein AAB627_01075 [Patescibacteria group bacterium]
MMKVMMKAPVTAAVLVAVVAVILSYVQGVEEMMSVDTWALLSLVFGLWVGYQGGNSWGKALWAGVAIGVVWAVLIVLGWGVVKAMGIDAVWSLAVFAFEMNVVGALIGGGFTMK